ncbi:hypothetical protein Leryth_017903 [Lithospermum erythrorhizon]|uniref:Uncharacterized protein n=1 Tax=Lithospermum erythrorhizon TaxID=34254 RepID=A0AAV3PE82_LITER|nr:hypothetical protein Leryth_017903 [Lithospermum erythrorhizon]
MALQNERKRDKNNPSCFGNWKFLNPSGWSNSRSKKGTRKKKKNSATSSIKSAVQMIQDQKKGNFLKKVMKRLNKYR